MVTINGDNLNLALLQKGFAWHAPGNAHFDTQFAYNEAQTEAMNSLSGLWGLDHGLRVPPLGLATTSHDREVRQNNKRKMEQQMKVYMEKRRQQQQTANQQEKANE